MKIKSKIKSALLISICAVVVFSLLWLGFLYWEGSQIPKLYFEGNIAGMEEKSDVRNIAFEYKNGDILIDGFAKIKVQGTSSLAYEKKNYTINLYQDAEYADDLEIDVGWGAQSKYCLKANWVDRTHSRNIVTAKLATQVQQKYDVLSNAPRNGLVDGFPVEIYINGDFLGLYTFNIPKDDWQFNMDSDNPDNIVVSGETYTPTNLFFEKPNLNHWSVEVGQESDETLEKLTRMFSFVIDSSDEEFKANFEQYLDLDAALNYYVMVDFAYLADNHGQNMLLATYDGEKWYLSLYDLDTSWGSYWNGYILNPYNEELLDMSRNNLFARMEKNFGKELAERYFELRQDILSKDHVMNEFENFKDSIPTISFIKETLRWGKGVIKKPEDIPGHDISQIDEYLDAVVDRLDEKYTLMLG